MVAVVVNLDIYVADDRRDRTPVDLAKCRKRMFGSWHADQCSRRAVVEEDGYGWCKQHAPSTSKARADARTAKWDRFFAEGEWNRHKADLEQVLVDAALAWHGGSSEDLFDALASACQALKAHLATRAVS